MGSRAPIFLRAAEARAAHRRRCIQATSATPQCIGDACIRDDETPREPNFGRPPASLSPGPRPQAPGMVTAIDRGDALAASVMTARDGAPWPRCPRSPDAVASECPPHRRLRRGIAGWHSKHWSRMRSSSRRSSDPAITECSNRRQPSLIGRIEAKPSPLYPPSLLGD